MSSRGLYEKILLDHAKNPRNFKVPEVFDVKLEGFNPLCGDQFTFYLVFDGDSIEQVYFHGNGCAVSKASASILTTLLEGKSKREALNIIESFIKIMKTSPNEKIDEDKLGKMAVLVGVREFPVRIKCATLPWHTVEKIIQGETHSVVSTE
ncbi:MAG: SUF system NifU family Fe-S cluster assembly protein [Candidatus Hydrogenedentes bacterium]|nr:SUF system NifU family Fe-S cluster assembly protein [Candidatus Hydrogenedentota bacterium]